MNTRYKVTRLGDGARYVRKIMNGDLKTGYMVSQKSWHDLVLPGLRMNCTLIGETWEEDRSDDELT